MTESDHITGL